MNGSIFWGLLFLILGANIIVNAVFKIDIPIVKIFLAGFFIVMGLNILMPSKKFNCNYFYTSSYETSNINYTSDQSNYNNSFCNSTIDLTYLDNLTEEKTVTINSQFSQINVKLPYRTPVHIKVNNTLSTIDMPDKKTNGDYVNLYGATKPLLYIIINSSFSNVNVN